MYVPFVRMISWGATAYRWHQWWIKRRQALRRKAWLRSAALTAGAIACSVVVMALLAKYS